MVSNIRLRLITVIITNLNGQVHPSGIDRQGLLRSRQEGASQTGWRDPSLEIDQFREDEQSGKAAAGHIGQSPEGTGPSQHREIRRSHGGQSCLQGVHHHGVLLPRRPRD